MKCVLVSVKVVIDPPSANVEFPALAVAVPTTLTWPSHRVVV